MDLGRQHPVESLPAAPGGCRCFYLPQIVKKEEVMMALIRDYKQTLQARAIRDPDFAVSLMNEAILSLLNGEPDTARLILRELVHSTENPLRY